ncbi:MAG: helix-turn-helix domain-containing protein [Eubacteriales bacterium]
MTQCERIHRHLQDYGTITPVEALREYGVMRLAARISDLKKRGVAIESRQTVGQNRTAKRCDIACIRWR